MIELDEHVQRLAESVELPRTAPEDYLALGRARRRRRNLGALGAAATTAAVITASVVVLSGGTGQPGSTPSFAGGPSAATPGDATARVGSDPRKQVVKSRRDLKRALRNLSAIDVGRVGQALNGYRDILREDLDPAGTRIQKGPITNQQTGDRSLGTKLDWNGGGMLEVAVGRSLEDVQFFCDAVCTRTSVTGATKALVLTSPGSISVAVFQDDGDIVALTVDRSFGNNGTSTDTLGLTSDQLLAAAADPRLDLPAEIGSGQLSGLVATQ